MWTSRISHDGSDCVDVSLSLPVILENHAMMKDEEGEVLKHVMQRTKLSFQSNN